MMERLVFALLVFGCGFLSALQLVSLVYGFPAHFETSWAEFGVTLVIALFAGLAWHLYGEER